jgi:hypothetical protein
MADAGRFHTTRRTVFAGAAGFAALAAPIVANGAPSGDGTDFVRAMQGIHPNGALAARQALAGGMRPESLYAIVMPGVVGNYEPALCFTQDGKNSTFRPTGRDS